MTSFAHELKTWRAVRRMSQLQLATEAEISSRHISFLETERARPSRDMVLHLSDILEIPATGRNDLLEAAGFAARYPRSDLSAAHMQVVRDAMTAMLSSHAPYPAVVMDRAWTLVELNHSAALLFGAAGLAQGDSLLDFLARPGAASDVISNWAEVGTHILHRLRTESRAEGGNNVLDDAAQLLARDPDIADFEPHKPLPPVLQTHYKAGGMDLPLISTFAQFGGAEDLTITELKIELMFPATPEASDFLRSL